MNLEFPIPGLFLYDLKRHEDNRGFFIKHFERKHLASLGTSFDTWESFYSSSQKGVIRGMHFQEPPVDQDKIVHCMRGKILDVLLDLRKGSSYGKVFSMVLDGKVPQSLFIPKGIAHGFLSLEEESWISYSVSTAYDSDKDRGIHWNSFGFDWKIKEPIVSARDQAHPMFKDYDSPFRLMG